ncbi:DUF2283 domain-containing protein [Rathayibacter sp. VKM Ac-2856]|uniref:DUF2283 domain-containing protein n=1 Tax=unclassified Rathayibacter TaxID=2609250 RepID=UPI001566D802|nr:MULTISPECIES: DUF2283 domain-containing protein [unclassified Rathayibacter]NQX05424.1 DUF2283 domain-containing protein [Rathayibacter sp. VKM Ac-2858]NQX20701.1 DUF2283 domain-containing protein [Rathayibacter sp. VKM Ac-2856]
MRIRYDPSANAAYLPVGREPEAGESVQQVHDIADPHGFGEIILDFDAAGHLIGVEIVGARALLRPETLADADVL